MTTPIVLPFTLTNGTTADATQVQANFNTLLNAVNGLISGGGATTSHVCVIGSSGPAMSDGVLVPLGTATTNAQIISDVLSEFNVTTGVFTPLASGTYNFIVLLGLTSTGVTYRATGAVCNLTKVGSSTGASLAGPLSGLGLTVLTPYKQTEFSTVLGDTWTFGCTANFSAGTPNIENYQILITRAT